MKAIQFIQTTSIKVAFVSTNSITQGEQVPAIWYPIYSKYNIFIDFAYRTFRWDSEANNKAHVHCVIIGFSSKIGKNEKYIFENDLCKTVTKINPYLVEGKPIFITKRNTPLCTCEKMIYGSEPREGGYLILNENEKYELLKETPQMKPYIKKFLSSADFINNKTRYCLWLQNADMNIVRKSNITMNRLKKCSEFRMQSKQKQAHASANQPYLFSSPRQPNSQYLLIPIVSSENRHYVPIGYMNKDVIVSNPCFTVSNASLYTFGIIISNIHMSWMRAVCGRLKSDYRYSNTIVYNNFPWPSPTDEQKQKIEETAQKILDARALYPDSSLADLYDPLTMPPELLKAHQENDKAVMRAYGFKATMDEADIVSELMKMYQELTK
ncbi:MAG: hypothetical protein LUF02_08810 [Erysipelotrichaceae bacterium]|nr:hypothetical protein [Erysipelotrichaceae bacterium]